MTMRPILRSIAAFVVASALGAPGCALAADELDALELESAPEPQPERTETPGPRVFVEAAAGRVDQRHGLPTLDSRRLSLDFSASMRLGEGWRAALSDRLDDVRPVGNGEHRTFNSLREAYVAKQSADGSLVVEAGRVNLRNGPAYGFNPTDYFRDGALRVVTTADPISLRENRLGTAMVLGQFLRDGKALGVAVAPKLADRPDSRGRSLDWGATNDRSRAVVSYSVKPSDRYSGQVLALFDDERGPQLGASMTALVSDAAVGFFEFSRGRDRDILNQALGAAPQRKTRNRLAAGLTYTTAWNLSLTTEYEYNGFALDEAGFKSLVAISADALGAYLVEAQRRQDIASRGAVLVHATLKDAGIKGLDVTALVRASTDDSSRLNWLELRYHWAHVDLAFQLQQATGRADSQFGILAYRRSAQLLAAYYF